MSNCLVEERSIQNIADSIRAKNGTQNKYLPSEMGDAILNIPVGKPEQTKNATPTTSQQIIEPDSGYALSSVTVNAVTSSIDSNIQANNIRKDVTILGITGNLEEGIDTSDATATANDIARGSTAYIKGVKVTGNVGVIGSGSSTIYGLNSVSPYGNDLCAYAKFSNNTLFRKDAKVGIFIGNSTVGAAGGLSSSVLLEGHTAFGITGSVNFTSFSDYDQCLSLTNDILGNS